MGDVRKLFAKMLAEVKHAEASHTRNAGTDYRCRQVFVEHGDTILSAFTPASDGRAEGLREAAEIVKANPAPIRAAAGWPSHEVEIHQNGQLDAAASFVAAILARAATQKSDTKINWRDDPDAIIEDDEPQIGRDYA